MPDRRRHEIGATAFEIGAMADLTARGPIEHAHCALAVYEGSQALSRLVPVDQEYDRHANRFEKCVAALFHIGLVAAGDEKKGTIAQAGRGFLIEAAPIDRESIE